MRNRIVVEIVLEYIITIIIMTMLYCLYLCNIVAARMYYVFISFTYKSVSKQLIGVNRYSSKLKVNVYLYYLYSCL